MKKNENESNFGRNTNQEDEYLLHA